MVLPTIPVGEAELEGLGDTLAVIVDVHHHATELVALWQCERAIGDDSRVDFSTF